MKELILKEKNELANFMRENNLTPESKLYRYTSLEYLEEIDNQFFLKAKNNPSDTVIDIYHGYSEVYNSSNIGDGISFLSAKEDEYLIDNRVCVVLELKDALEQGCLVYPIISLPAYLKAFFCTLPEGIVKITIDS